MIPIAEMTSWFDLMEDKVASAYWTSTERDQFIYRATIKFIDSLFPIWWKPNMAITSQMEEAIAPLINEVTVQTDSTGRLQYATVSSAIEAESGVTGAEYLRMLNAAWAATPTCGLPTVYYYAKYVRHNDYLQFSQNLFKVADIKYPSVRLMEYIQFNPKVSGYANLTTLRYPVKVVSSGTTVDSDMPYFTMDYIMKIALLDAGFSMRDIDWVVAQKQANGNTD